MRIFGIQLAGVVTGCLFGLVAAGQPVGLMAQTAAIHGHVVNPAGVAVSTGEVRLTTDKTPGNSPNRKWDYTFPLDKSGNYKGSDIKPATYIVVVYQGNQSVDFNQNVPLVAGDDKVVDFDMTRKEYIDKMSPADKEALEEYKKKNAEVVANNSKVANLNAMLATARTDIKAANYDPAIKSMTDATTAKPDEPILWETLGDANLGAAVAADKAAKAAKATDASVPEKYNAAVTAYQKALSLNAAAAKPNVDITATANNQLGQAFGKLGKTKEASEAYDAAAKAQPAQAGMYFYNEAATLFNANDPDGAATAADKAIAADPAKADAYYIKGQALIGKAAVDQKTGKITTPPGCVDSYQKYLELAPTGAHAQEVKDILTGIGEPIKSTFKAPGKK